MAVDFRQEIRQRLNALGKSRYWLSGKLAGKISHGSLYTYLREKDPTEIGADKLTLILEALEDAENERHK